MSLQVYNIYFLYQLLCVRTYYYVSVFMTSSSCQNESSKHYWSDQSLQLTRLHVWLTMVIGQPSLSTSSLYISHIPWVLRNRNLTWLLPLVPSRLRRFPWMVDHGCAYCWGPTCCSLITIISHISVCICIIVIFIYKLTVHIQSYLSYYYIHILSELTCQYYSMLVPFTVKRTYKLTFEAYSCELILFFYFFFGGGGDFMSTLGWIKDYLEFKAGNTQREAPR